MTNKYKRDEDYCCLNGCMNDCCKPSKRPKIEAAVNSVTILDLLEVDICRSAILDYLSLAEILRSERVCMRWRGAMHHYIRGSVRLRRRLHVCSPWHPARPPRLPLDETRDPWLESSLYKWGTSVEAAPCTVRSFGLVAECCPNLKELTFYGVPDPDSVRDSNGKLEKINVIAFKNLHSAPKSNNQHSDQSIGIFLEKESLEDVTIIANDQLTGSCFNHLRANLTTLRIQDCPVLDYRLLVPTLKHLRELKTLELTRNSSEIMQNIHLLLENSTKLEHLELCWYDKVEMGDGILEVLSRLDGLKHLILRHNNNVVDGWLDALKGTKLMSLDVSFCQDVTYEGVLTALRPLRSWLEALGVAGMCHELTNEGVETILRLCPFLKLFDLQQCGGLTSNLVSYLCRLLRRGAWGLPRLRVRLAGAVAPYTDTDRLPRNLILDYSSQSQLLPTNEHEHEHEHDNTGSDFQRHWFGNLSTLSLLGERDSNIEALHGFRAHQ